MTIRPRPWRERIRLLLGFGALGCTVSCDAGSDYCALELQNEPVLLTLAHPEHRSRFLVESNQSSFTLRLTFKTETGSPPSLDAHALEPGAQVEFKSIRHLSDSEFEWVGEATLNCGDEFPCAARFETVVTANPAASGDVEGTLSGVVVRSTCSTNPKHEYLAVEPL